MLERIRNNIFIRLTWGILGLYLLNTSVDFEDLNPEYIAEDLTINDQESILEIILEKILGYENAIHEYDDYDSDESKKQSSVKFEIKINSGNNIPICLTGKRVSDHYYYLDSHLSKGHYKLHTPPPEIDLFL